jgi:hypothetical protein
LKELPVLRIALRKQNQRILNFWVFEKNPIKELPVSGISKTSKNHWVS